MVTTQVGTPGARDAADSDGFRRYLTAEALHDLWAPPPDSPWAPFHAVTLFAAVERNLDAPFPTGVEAARALAAPLADTPLDPDDAHAGAPTWLAEDALVIVDLPGPLAVAAAVGLARRGGQPVCTFDNWPHGAGLLKPERVLGQLLHYAVVFEAQVAAVEATTATTPAPPVWICDRDRLTGRAPVPTDFDNRYYLDDSLLPGTHYLRAHGIARVVIVVDADAPLAADLAAWLNDRHADGVAIARVVLGSPTLDAEPFVPPPAKPATPGRRSDAGGFGVLVPVPSQGSGG